MSYPGGKNGSGVCQQIINRIPPHDIYIEPFLGAGAVLRTKRPARINVACDIDPAVVGQFRWTPPPELTLLQVDALEYLRGITLSLPTFIYLDPPYRMSTRSSQRRLYAAEFSDEQHAALLETIKDLDCMAMISGYNNALYDDALSGWERATFKTTNRAGSHVTESLWMNYPPPQELHDYRFLGDDYRERERIKRKKARWITRLLSMSNIERNALTAAIAETADAAGRPAIKSAVGRDRH